MTMYDYICPIYPVSPGLALNDLVWPRFVEKIYDKPGQSQKGRQIKKKEEPPKNGDNTKNNDAPKN